MVRAGQHLSGRREGPAVEVAPRLEEPQHSIEATGERLRAAPDLSPQVLELAGDPLGLRGAPEVRVAVGTVGDGMGLGGDEGVVGAGRRLVRLGSGP